MKYRIAELGVFLFTQTLFVFLMVGPMFCAAEQLMFRTSTYRTIFHNVSLSLSNMKFRSNCSKLCSNCSNQNHPAIPLNILYTFITRENRYISKVLLVQQQVVDPN